MYTDPSGEIVLSTALIIIGAIAGVITGGYIGYQAVVNDPTLTTSQKLASIGLCAILGGIAGGFFGAGLGYALPAMISGGIGSATEAALVGAVAISLEEAVIMGVAVGIAGSGIVYSKSNPGMSNKPPVTWTNLDEGLEVYDMFKGNSEKAAEYLLNNKYGPGKWHKGAKTDFNALKKWFDRVIRNWRR